MGALRTGGYLGGRKYNQECAEIARNVTTACWVHGASELSPCLLRSENPLRSAALRSLENSTTARYWSVSEAWLRQHGRRKLKHLLTGNEARSCQISHRSSHSPLALQPSPARGMRRCVERAFAITSMSSVRYGTASTPQPAQQPLLNLLDATTRQRRHERGLRTPAASCLLQVLPSLRY